jgi:hypothetical protein
MNRAATATRSKARALIAEHDGKVDAIGLEGLPASWSWAV